MLRKLAAKGTPGVQYAKLDVQKYGNVAQHYSVRSIPDTRIYHNGVQVGAFVGSRNAKAIEKLLAPHRSKLVRNEVAPEEAVPDTAQPANQPSSKRKLPPGIQAIPAS